MYQSFLFRSAGRNHAQQSPSCGPLARLAAGAYCLVGDYSRYVTVGGCCQVDWVVIAPHAHPGAAQDLDEAVCGVEAAEDVEGGDGHAGLLSLRLEDGHAGVAAGTQNVLIVALLSIGHVGGVSAAGVPHISRQRQPADDCGWPGSLQVWLQGEEPFPQHSLWSDLYSADEVVPGS